MFENRVLRGIFGAKWEEVIGEWRKLHNEDLNDLYCSPNIVQVMKSRRMRWAGHVARVGEERGVYGVLVGKLEGKTPLERTSYHYYYYYYYTIWLSPVTGHFFPVLLSNQQ